MSPVKKNIAIIDPASYSLPYDYFFILELTKYYNVDFYCSKTKYNAEYINRLKSIGINVIEYRISSSVTNRLNSLLNYIKLLLSVSARIKKYEKIHFLWSVKFLLEIPFFCLFKRKLIFTLHNVTPHNYKKSTYYPYKIISKVAKKIIFVSEYTQFKFNSCYQYKYHSYLLPHGLLPLEVDNIERDRGITKTIIFWGVVEEYKGVDIFLQKSFIGEAVKVIGKWNPSFKALKEKLDKMENIEVVDKYLNAEELNDILQQEAVFILPYIKATQSGVLYTYLAHEKVFISSDTGDTADFLRKNGLSQLIFDRTDDESIKKTIEYAFNNYSNIKNKIVMIKDQYKWDVLISQEMLQQIYG